MPRGHENAPAMHCDAELAPTTAVDLPIGHDTHAAIEDAPVVVRNVERGHGSHAADDEDAAA